MSDSLSFLIMTNFLSVMGTCSLRCDVEILQSQPIRDKYFTFPSIMAQPQFFFFFYIFGGHECFLLGHWYPYFGLLVTSPLGFTARVGSALFELSGGIPVMLHVPWDSPLVWHLLTLAASMAAEPSLPHICKALVGLETRSYHFAAQPKLLDCVKDNSKDNEDLLLTRLEVQ